MLNALYPLELIVALLLNGAWCFVHSLFSNDPVPCAIAVLCFSQAAILCRMED